MKNLLILWAFILSFTGLQAQNSITTGEIPANLCVGQTLNIPFTATGIFNAGNIFSLEISDQDGVFPGSILNQINCNNNCDSIQVVIPENTVAGNQYRFRVNSTNPPLSGADNGSNISIHSRPWARADVQKWTAVAGNPLTFYGSGKGGSGIYTSFYWTGPSNFISYQQNPVIQSLTTQNSGAYTFKLTDTYGCASNNNVVIDLFVHTQQLILSNSVSKCLPAGSNTNFIITTVGNPSCQWQVSSNQGTNWSNLANNTMYQNVTTPSLHLTGINSTIDGNTYRCRLDFPGIGIGYSKPSLLNIQGDTLVTWIDTTHVCDNGTLGIHFPIRVKNFNNVGSISLSVLSSITEFQFVAFADTNPLLIPSGFMVSNVLQQNGMYDCRFGWFATSLYPLSLPDSAILIVMVMNYNGESSTFTFNQYGSPCMYSDVVGNVIPAVYHNGYVNTVGCNSLQGTLTYDNADASPMGNQAILLKQNGQVKYTTYTDSLGFYEFDGVMSGLYDIEVICNLQWSNTTSVDALLGAEYFTGSTELTVLKSNAADVNQSHYVNAVDCLLMLERFVGQINFYPGGDWKFSEHSININSPAPIQVLNIKGICSGDLNGSYTGP